MKKNLFERVEEEMLSYDNAYEAAIDHLKMAESHLFEEFEGSDINGMLSEIKKTRIKLENELLWRTR